MLRRPTAVVLLQPGLVSPGDELICEVRLTSDRPRAITGITLGLVGTERLNVPGPAPERELFRFVARFPAEELPDGERRYRVPFRIPGDAPPTVRGRVLRIGYELQLRVGLPWWPDVDRRFEVPVRPAPRPRVEEPRIFTGALDDRSGDARAEATFASTELAPGEALIGAVSLLHPPRREGALELALVARERTSGHGTTESVRYVARIAQRAEVGEAVRFAVRLPEGALPTASGAFGSCDWSAEIDVVGALSREPLLVVPLLVTARASTDTTQGPATVRLVGRSRRLDLWRRVAARGSMSFDEASGTIRTQRGPVEIELEAQAEGENGPRMVARLRHPRLGIELALRERGWSDRLGPVPVPGLGSRFDERFVLHARESTCARSVLGPSVLEALFAVDGARLDDAGGELWLSGTGLDEGALRLVLECALTVAGGIASALESMPFAPPVSAVGPAWERFARARSARLVRGELCIEELVVGEHRAAFGLSWRGADRIVGSHFTLTDEMAARRLRDTGLDDAGRFRLWSSISSPDERSRWQAMDEELRARGELLVEGDALRLVTSDALGDPSDALPVLEQLSALALAARGRRSQSAYR
jgi:hypothetical protein